MTVDTNLAIIAVVGIGAAAHVLATLIERVTDRRNDTNDAVQASVTLKRMVGEHPPGTHLAVTVGDVTVEAQTPDPADDGDEWKQRA